MNCQIVPTVPGYFAYRLTPGKFPLAVEPRAAWRDIAAAILTAPTEGAPPEWEVFAQFNALHLDPAKNQLSRRGAAWIPEMCLGLFPGEPPPALYTDEEIMALTPGQNPRPLFHQLLRISKEGDPRREALNTFAGTGALACVQYRTEGSAEGLSEVLRATIEEDAFTAFPLNVPLISARTARLFAEEKAVQAMLPHIRQAIHEDHLTGEISLFLTAPIEKVLAPAGLTRHLHLIT